MDHDKFAHKMGDIGKRIPKNLKESALRTEKVASEQREQIERIMKNDKISKETKEFAAKQIADGRLDKTRQVVDEKKAAEISKAWDYHIDKAVKSGEIPDPKSKEVRDNYRRFMESRPNNE